MIITMVMMHLLTDTAESDDGMRYIEVRDAIVAASANVTRRPPLVTDRFDHHTLWPTFSPWRYISKRSDTTSTPKCALAGRADLRDGRLRARAEPSRV